MSDLFGSPRQPGGRACGSFMEGLAGRRRILSPGTTWCWGAAAGARSRRGKGLNRLREGGASCGPLFLLLIGLSLLFEVRGPWDLGGSLGKMPTITSSVFWTLHTNILNTKPAQAFFSIFKIYCVCVCMYAVWGWACHGHRTTCESHFSLSICVSWRSNSLG